MEFINIFFLQFDQNGYVVIKKFLNEKETVELKDAGEKLTENVPAGVKTVFATNQTKQVIDPPPFIIQLSSYIFKFVYKFFDSKKNNINFKKLPICFIMSHDSRVWNSTSHHALKRACRF